MFQQIGSHCNPEGRHRTTQNTAGRAHETAHETLVESYLRAHRTAHRDGKKYDFCDLALIFVKVARC
ncbi:MAG: hypothetical protein ABSG18_26240, partial [Steroidobacteraceae bacterium]